MSYIGQAGKLSQRAYSKVDFLAEAGQTTKTGLSYVAGFVEVYQNGFLLTNNIDYTATNGNSVTFVTPLILDDEVTVVSLKTFSIADTYTQTQADTLFTGDQTKADIEALGIAASSITGSLPAIDGSALTNLPGGGKVLQVITKNGLEFSRTNSTSYVASTLFADITPISPTSKMVVCFNSKLWVDGDGGNCRGYVKIYCNGVDVDANYYKSVRPSTGYNDQQIYTMLPTATRLTHTHNSSVLLQYRLYMKTVITGSGTTYAWTYAENQEDYYDITIFEIEQ